MELLHADVSSTILKGFYAVANEIPFGLDKSFYCNALTIELQQSGLKIDNNKTLEVKYKHSTIGQLTIDLVANNAVLMEILSEDAPISPEKIELSKNYLRLSDFEVLLILNFGIEAEHKRVFLSKDYKNR
jgi:GxxExxY protein